MSNPENGEQPNPVTPEDIVGIPSPAQKDEEGEKRKSPDRKIPEKVQEEFKNFVKSLFPGENMVIDAENLFFASQPQVGSNITTRAYLRYLEGDSSSEKDVADFFNQGAFFINPEGYFALFKQDIDFDSKRGIATGMRDPEAIHLRVSPKDLEFSQVIDDQTLTLNYDPKNQHSYLALHRVTNIRPFDEILQEALSDEESSQAEEVVVPQANERPDFALAFSPDTINAMIYDEKWNRKITEVKMVEEFVVNGRRLQVANAGEEVKIVFYRRDDPDTVDYEITLPRKQETEDYWSGDMNQTQPIKRYTWEKDLIPEPLRTNIHVPKELDDVWKRADLAKTIGIKIERNLAA